MPLLPRYVVPLSQHIGTPGEPIVEVGEYVARGQPLSRVRGDVSVPVHSPTSGTVSAVKEFPHPLGRPSLAIEISSDGEDHWEADFVDGADWRNLSPQAIRERVRDAGLVGMGGATFPTHIKLDPPADKPVDTLIVNGAECEPYLTSDHRLMLERSRDVMNGVGILRRVLGAKRVFVGVESNKLDALETLRAVSSEDAPVQFVLLETKYPEGSEKHLIYAITGRKVAPGGLPLDVGCLVQNVGTAAAAAAAIERGMPLIERFITITGHAIRHPKNLLIRIGTPLRDVIEQCGGWTDDIGKVIFGGPMMGLAQFRLDVPITKGTSGILCLPKREIAQFVGGPCIHCGRCVEACPMHLLPHMIGMLVESRRYGGLQQFHVLDCIECGSCAFACPACRPLVQLLRQGKAVVRKARDPKALAPKA